MPTSNIQEASGNELAALGAQNLQVLLSDHGASLAAQLYRTIESFRNGEKNEEVTAESTIPHPYPIYGVNPLDKQQPFLTVHDEDSQPRKIQRPSQKKRQQLQKRLEKCKQISGIPIIIWFHGRQNENTQMPETGTRPVAAPTSAQKQDNSSVEFLEPGMQSVLTVNGLLKSGGLFLLKQPDPAPVRDIQSPNWKPGFWDVKLNVAENVDCIYVQRVAGESVVKVIQQKLKDYFPTGPKLTTPPPVGSFVAALYDGDVFRARITKVSGRCITLFFVDYGNTSTVSLADVRPLPDKLYQYPATCKRVALVNVARSSGPISTAVKILLSGWTNQICNMLVVPRSSELTECILNKDERVLNELVSDLLDQLENVKVKDVTQEMQQLETDALESVPQEKEEVAVDHTVGEYFYEEIPVKEDLEASGGPQLITKRESSSEGLSVQLGQLEVLALNY